MHQIAHHVGNGNIISFFFFFFFLVGAVIRDVKVQDWLRTRNSNYLDSISGPFPTLIAPMTHGI